MIVDDVDGLRRDRCFILLDVSVKMTIRYELGLKRRARSSRINHTSEVRKISTSLRDFGSETLRALNDETKIDHSVRIYLRNSVYSLSLL